MQRTRWSYFGGLGCLAVTAFLFSFQSPDTSSPITLDPAAVSLRVRFGVTDEKPLGWDGQLAVEGGEVLQLRNWRPRPGDAIEGTQKLEAQYTAGTEFRAPACRRRSNL